MKQFLRNSPWAARDARIVLPARAISSAGTAVTTVAAMLLLHDAGAGPFGIAAFLACLAIPTIAMVGIAGRVVDTVDSRWLLCACGVAQLAACIVLGALPVPGVIYATGFCIALAQAFAQPAWQALIPRVVGLERIGSAIAWQQGLNAVALPVGAALGGLLVSVGEVRWGFWLDAATYAALTVAALLIRARRNSEPQAPTMPEGWTAGIRFVVADKTVWPIFVAILVFVVLVEGVNPVEIFLVRDELNATAFEYGLSEFFAGSGAIAGAVIAARVLTDDRRAASALAGFGIAALSLVAAGLAPGYWIYAGTIAVLAAAFGLGNATFGALLTSRTPDSHRGRVYAALNALARTASLLALALGSLANASLGARPTFVIAGVAGAVVMLVATVRVRRGRIREGVAVQPREG